MPPHECEPDRVATARLLTRETRPCPSCKAMIMKDSGCNQMFCTLCHTAFDWVTGEVETGRIHNPHYYEWLRLEAGAGPIRREVGDGGCAAAAADGAPQGVPDWAEFYYRAPLALRTAPRDAPSGMLWYLFGCAHREAVHVDARLRIEAVRAVRNPTAGPAGDPNHDLRVRFLAGEVDEGALRVALQRREKARYKEVAVRQVQEMFVGASSDILRSMLEAGLHETANVRSGVQQLEALRLFTNEAAVGVAKRFASAAPLVLYLRVQDVQRHGTPDAAVHAWLQAGMPLVQHHPRYVDDDEDMAI